MVKILEEFSKIWLNKHGLCSSSKAEKRMLERKAISSLRKGMFMMFTCQQLEDFHVKTCC